MYFILFISPLLVLTLIVWAIATVVGWSYGKLGRAMAATRLASANEPTDKILNTRLSVVICVHNKADALRRHLPAVLHQDYDAFEVIVVDMASTDETRKVLATFEHDNPHLRHTYTPASARDVSTERLALTLGLRAARGEWVVVTHADAEPTSPQWLRTIAASATEWRTLLLAPARYADDAPSRPRYVRLWNTFLEANHVLAGNTPVRVGAANMAIRRETLIAQGSTADDCNLRYGTLDILVNHVARQRSTAYLTDMNAIVVEDAPPSANEWRRQQIFDIETRRHLGHTTLFRIKENVFMLMPWMLRLCTGATVAVSVVAALFAASGQPLPEAMLCFGRTAASIPYDAAATFIAAIVVAAIVTIMYFIYVAVKASAFNRSTRALGARTLTMAALFYEGLQPFTRLALRWRWMRTPDNDFRKPFV